VLTKRGAAWLCNPEALKHVPLFALLDEERNRRPGRTSELKKFATRQRIYKTGDSSGQAYVMVTEESVSPLSTRTTKKSWSMNRPTANSRLRLDARADSTPNDRDCP